ncbi:hypothetical protein [Roseovarius sp.]|uniref:hypothetical protein n=1 Tax=Roseovarius sp. TaxID=1486281 RepID=UPI003BAA2B1D
MVFFIDNVPSNAPLFKNAPEDDLRQVIKHLQLASHHYADDSGREWGLARKHVSDAAEILNRNSLEYRAIQAIHREARPLMPLDDVIDEVLRLARSVHPDPVEVQ